MSMHHVPAWCPQRAEAGAGSPGTTLCVLEEEPGSSAVSAVSLSNSEVYKGVLFDFPFSSYLIFIMYLHKYQMTTSVSSILCIIQYSFK